MKIYRRCKLCYVVCDECGGKFKPGCHRDGLPNGASFELTDGRKIDICYYCLVNYGEEKKVDKNTLKRRLENGADCI